MKAYTFEQLTVGLTHRFQAVITEEMMQAFCMLSGDENPLHCDEAYANAQGYPGRVVYGMLTAALCSRLAGMYLPGQYCLLQSVQIKFARPVFIGDELSVEGVVAERFDSVRAVVVKATIQRGGVTVAKAAIQAGVLK